MQLISPTFNNLKSSIVSLWSFLNYSSKGYKNVSLVAVLE